MAVLLRLTKLSHVKKEHQEEIVTKIFDFSVKARQNESFVWLFLFSLMIID